MADLPLLLNPLTPMAYLLPDVAYGTTMASYVVIGATGGLLWDVLINVDGDYKLLFKRKLSFTTFAYFVSRESVLIFALLNTIFQTAQLPSCEDVQLTISGLYPVASCFTALLFYGHVRACFNRSHYVTAAFLVLWFGVLGGGVAAAKAIAPATFIGPTSYCIHGSLMAFANAAPVMFAVNNTFLFLVIAWCLFLGPSSSTNASFDLSGGDIPSALRKALLQEGQVCHLIAVMCNWSMVVVDSVLRDLPAHWFAFTVFNLAVTNIMVCTVYRETVLRNASISSESGSGTTPLESIRFAVNQHVTVGFSTRSHRTTGAGSFPEKSHKESHKESV